MKPCERIIRLSIPTGYSVHDTAWSLSQQNRMSFRQGMEYAYDTLEIFGLDPASEGAIDVYRLPNTWVTANAWVKSYHVWKNQQDEALEAGDAESTVARYRDFKLYYNKAHIDGSHEGTSTVQIHPSGFLDEAAAQLIDAGAAMDWEYSQFVIPNYQGSAGVAVEADGYLLGPDVGSDFGLIHNYAMSRARPHPLDPSRVSDADPAVTAGS